MHNRTFWLFSFLFAILSGCSKDEIRTIAREGTMPVLTASSSEVILEKDKAADTAVTFNWTNSDFGFSGLVNYVLEIDRKGNGFNKPAEKSGNGSGLNLTVLEFNTVAFTLGLDPGVATGLEIRVKADIGGGFPPVYSAPVDLTLTSYLDLIVYPYMYVPGSYQGWNPGSAGKIAAITRSDLFEGYLFFPDGLTNFKITPERKWDVAYGGTSANNEGNLSTSGGNLEVNGNGYYFLKADMASKTWKAVKTQWAVVGSATGSWDTDKDMAFDPVSNTWAITIDLVKGEMKFRANDAWDLNYGDNKPGDPFLNFNASNIKIEENGTYTISLDLSDPGNYTYNIRKA